MSGLYWVDEDPVKVFGLSRASNEVSALPRSLHDLRLFYGSLLLAFGEPIIYICQQMGHLTITNGVVRFGPFSKAGIYSGT